MMKKLLMILMLLVVCQLAKAQGQNNKDKIKAARIAFLTERLGLTPEQAEKFWPIYNEYTQKRISMKKEFRKANSNVDAENASETEKQRLLEMGLELKQKELDLEKEYSGKLMDVITSQQMISLRKAEGDFRKMLLNRLQQRQNQRKRTEQYRERRNERLERRNN